MMSYTTPSKKNLGKNDELGQLSLRNARKMRRVVLFDEDDYDADNEATITHEPMDVTKLNVVDDRGNHLESPDKQKPLDSPDKKKPSKLDCHQKDHWKYPGCHRITPELTQEMRTLYQSLDSRTDRLLHLAQYTDVVAWERVHTGKKQKTEEDKMVDLLHEVRNKNTKLNQKKLVEQPGKDTVFSTLQQVVEEQKSLKDTAAEVVAAAEKQKANLDRMCGEIHIHDVEKSIAKAHELLTEAKAESGAACAACSNEPCEKDIVCQHKDSYQGACNSQEVEKRGNGEEPGKIIVMKTKPLQGKNKRRRKEWVCLYYAHPQKFPGTRICQKAFQALHGIDDTKQLRNMCQARFEGKDFLADGRGGANHVLKNRKVIVTSVVQYLNDVAIGKTPHYSLRPNANDNHRYLHPELTQIKLYLGWLEKYDPEGYKARLERDRKDMLQMVEGKVRQSSKKRKRRPPTAKLSESTFKRIVRMFDLSRASPPSDTCRFCDRFAVAIHAEEDDAKRARLEKAHLEHLQRADRATAQRMHDVSTCKEYFQDFWTVRDWLAPDARPKERRACDDTTQWMVNTILSDMGSHLPWPITPTNPNFYARKFHSLDYIIYDASLRGKSSFYVWPQFSAKQGALETLSCVIRHHFENYTGAEICVHWADRCPGQMCNWAFLRAMQHFVENGPTYKMYVIKFFESGHSYMGGHMPDGTQGTLLRNASSSMVTPSCWEDLIEDLANGKTGKKGKNWELKRMAPEVVGEQEGVQTTDITGDTKRFFRNYSKMATEFYDDKIKTNRRGQPVKLREKVKMVTFGGCFVPTPDGNMRVELHPGKIRFWYSHEWSQTADNMVELHTLREGVDPVWQDASASEYDIQYTPEISKPTIKDAIKLTKTFIEKKHRDYFKLMERIFLANNDDVAGPSVGSVNPDGDSDPESDAILEGVTKETIVSDEMLERWAPYSGVNLTDVLKEASLPIWGSKAEKQYRCAEASLPLPSKIQLQKWKNDRKKQLREKAKATDKNQESQKQKQQTKTKKKKKKTDK